MQDCFFTDRSDFRSHHVIFTGSALAVSSKEGSKPLFPLSALPLFCFGFGFFLPVTDLKKKNQREMFGSNSTSLFCHWEISVMFFK